MKINKCGCGGEAVIRDNCSITTIQHWVYCSTCYVSTSRYNRTDQAIDAWNTAHPDTSDLQQQNAELKEQLKMLNGYRNRIKLTHNRYNNGNLSN